MADDLFGVVAVAVILGIGVVALGPAFIGGSDRVSASESVTVDYSGATNVSEEGLRYDDEVRVSDSNGTALREDVDYDWDQRNGTISFVNTSATTAGESVTVAYEYREAGQRQQTVAAVVNALGLPLVLLLFLLAGGYVFRVIN